MKSPTFGLGLRLATTVHWQHVFLYTSLPLLHDRYVKLPYFTFYEGREHEKPISFFFFFFFILGTVFSDSTPEKFANIWQLNEVE